MKTLMQSFFSMKVNEAYVEWTINTGSRPSSVLILIGLGKWLSFISSDEFETSVDEQGFWRLDEDGTVYFRGSRVIRIEPRIAMVSGFVIGDSQLLIV